eukprot:c40812_g1_i1 orf=37-456(-)
MEEGEMLSFCRDGRPYLVSVFISPESTCDLILLHDQPAIVKDSRVLVLVSCTEIKRWQKVLLIYLVLFGLTSVMTLLLTLLFADEAHSSLFGDGNIRHFLEPTNAISDDVIRCARCPAVKHFPLRIERTSPSFGGFMLI